MPLDLRALRRECERTILFIDVLTSCAEAYGLTGNQVWHCEDERPNSQEREARAEVWTRLKDAGWSWAFIARVFDRDKTTVRETVMRRLGIKRERRAA